MGSTRPTDRSIGEATFLPQWMKGKSETRFDYSDGAFSPPADDTFFLIRYPKPEPSANREGFRSISDFLAGGSKHDNSNTSSNTIVASSETTAAGHEQQQFSKQLAAFEASGVNNSSSSSNPKLIFANKSRPKPLDDEFRTSAFAEKPALESGRSIVTVASQIMFGKASSSNINNNNPNSQVDVLSTANSTLMAAGQQQKSTRTDSSVQSKGSSKSLPATPLTSPSGTPDSSPRARRRAYGNRFFTGAFVPPESGERPKNGWLLGSILGQSRELVTPKIEEEDELQHHQPEQVPARALSRKKSISSQNLTYFGKEEKQSSTAATTTTTTTTVAASASSTNIAGHVLQAQPSELREMNFWSPTSM